MASPPCDLRQQVHADWLVGCDQSPFIRLVEHRLRELAPYREQGIQPHVCLAEREPIPFLAGFLAACLADGAVFLCNPNWTPGEWRQVFDLVRPELVWGLEGDVSNRGSQPDPAKSLSTGSATPGRILIPTGGSSGQVRFAIHTWETLIASVQGFQQYFQVKGVNALCVLPLYHVSGLMQVLRSLTSGGQLLIYPFRALAEGTLPAIDPAGFFISLVPTQLHRLLSTSQLTQPGDRPIPDWLSQFHAVLLGGGPAWPELLTAARQQQIPLALTYGMTETASQIAALKPEAFLAGDNSCGQVLPHAQVMVCDAAGKPLAANQIGSITIQARSLALGYYPAQPLSGSRPGVFQPDDLGCFTAQRELRIVGRSSDKIISGGEKVFPAEVEAAVRATQWVEDVAVVGVPDAHWGQVVTALYVPRPSSVSAQTLQAAIAPTLSRFKHPKYWIPVRQLPRNAQGKVSREQLLAIAQAWLQDPANGAATE